MKTVTFVTPALYGDHHVKEVRRVLAAVPGVQEIYASSAFRVVEVSFDETLVSEADLSAKLVESGYLGETAMAAEKGVAAHLAKEQSTDVFFRHTQVFEGAKQAVSFGQKVNYSGRPLWNCPGFGVIKSKMED
jgi:copper chaperone CopZ